MLNKEVISTAAMKESRVIDPAYKAEIAGNISFAMVAMKNSASMPVTLSMGSETVAR